MDEDKRTKTLVIPTYSLDSRLINLAYKCATSHKKQVDQIIISEDGGLYSKKLKDVSDIYIYRHSNIGFTKNVNLAWEIVKTDFVIIANSDTFLKDGNLRDLCVNGMVTCPNFKNKEITTNGFSGSYFCVPKEIKSKYGMLDERLKNFESDVDYYERIKHIFRIESRVKIYHYKAQTLKRSDLDTKYESTKDAEIYRKIIIENYPERKIW